MILIFIFSFLLSSSPSYAINTMAEGYKIDDSTAVEIDAHSTCKKVTNNSGQAQFVATKTSAEWTSFLENLPSGITVADCAPSDPCGASPSPGDTCTGGAIYLGSLSPGAISGTGTDRYMTTPGGCTDSATPTCSGTDSLTKIWRGSSGSFVDITALVNYTSTAGTGNGAINKDQNYGDANTTAIVSDASVSSDSAADYCNDLVYGGYSDWYLPNRYELNLIWANRASIPGVNTTGYYKSSTEYSSQGSWIQSFADGYQGNGWKHGIDLVRCVRRF